MKNVTITLDEEVARWARIRAAERDTSLSRLVGKLLREKMLDDLNPSAYKWQAYSVIQFKDTQQWTLFPDQM